jgi:hypothetical protein
VSVREKRNWSECGTSSALDSGATWAGVVGLAKPLSLDRLTISTSGLHGDATFRTILPEAARRGAHGAIWPVVPQTWPAQMGSFCRRRMGTIHPSSSRILRRRF